MLVGHYQITLESSCGTIMDTAAVDAHHLHPACKTLMQMISNSKHQSVVIARGHIKVNGFRSSLNAVRTFSYDIFVSANFRINGGNAFSIIFNF